MFWFKRNKTELVIFYDDPELIQMYPVLPANKMFPDYYKTLPSKYTKQDKKDHPFPNSPANQQSTIRGCYGINNFNIDGFILPLWCEHTFFVKDNFKIFLHKFIIEISSLLLPILKVSFKILLFVIKYI